MSIAHKAWTVFRMPRAWADVAVALVIAVRIERLIRRADLATAASWAGVSLALDGEAAGAADEARPVEFTPRERERLDIAWRVLKTPPFNATCLRRALVGGYFLRHRRPKLRVGVAKRDGEVFAHAWIEIDGVSLDPDAPDRFAVLATPAREGRT